MSKLAAWLRNNLPDFILEKIRGAKKKAVRNNLQKQQQSGDIITKEFLLRQLHEMGIVAGDHLMVHSAMSKIGYLDEGPKTFVDALLEAVGPTGTVCMPSSPVKKLQLDFIRETQVFDVRKTPSAMGAITEYFRNLPNTKRSLHPTEPVCANGNLAKEVTEGHFGEQTPYTAKSPWKKLMESGAKILYVGVTLDNAGTHLHTLEDAVDFKFPVYHSEIFRVRVIDNKGAEHEMETRVHNPEFSKRRRCDELIPLFERENVLQKTKLGKAECLLLDANAMFECMVKNYREHGITMYTPHGEKIIGYDD
jgi:aminoglycoside 3-N-acetyltransferase